MGEFCKCEACQRFRQEVEKRGEPLTFKGFPIRTQHDLAFVDFPYPPEPHEPAS